MMMNVKALRTLFFITLYTVVVLLALEAWHRSSIGAVYEWVSDKPYLFFLNVLILLSLFLLFITVFGRVRVALIVGSILMVLFFTTSRIKMSLKGEPLLPWDVFLGNEAANIHEYFVLMSIRDQVLLLLLVLGFIGVAYFFSNEAIRYKQRAIFYLPIPLLVFLLLFFEKPISLLNFGEVNNVFWDQSITYQRNGVQVGFLHTLQLLNIEPPKGYSVASINELVQYNNEEGKNTRVKPNVIMIMNEAFWDLTLLPNVKFSEDPLPFFRGLQKEHTGGELLVPVFGGSTANTEFEILTGNSMYFLPQGSIPYSQYVHQPISTLASILRAEGYESVAIHNYHNWFYRRNQVYENFGFDRFISQSFFENPEYRRDNISDLEMSRQIIKEHKKTEKPLFAFAVTMQNHGPYNARHYSENRLTVKGDLPEDTLTVLNTYSTGVKDADDSLQYLVDYFEKSGEPTVIVFFGDHLPYLGAEYRAYTETDFIGEANPELWTKQEYEKMFSVPFVVWDNFSRAKQGEIHMNASFLGPFLLEKYDFPQTKMMKYLNELLAEDKSLISMKEEVSELSIEELSKYEMLQYDQLFGERYFVDEQLLETDEDYRLGSQPLKITRVAPDSISINDIDGESLEILVYGENFTTKTVLIINGEKMPTVFHDSATLSTTISTEELYKLDVLRVVAAIIDSKNRELSSSEFVDIQVKVNKK